MSDYKLEGVAWDEPDDTVTWSLADTNFADRGYQFTSFAPQGFLADIEAAFDKWSSVSGVKFDQVADSSTTDIRFGLNAVDGQDNVVGETDYITSGYKTSAGLDALRSADIEFDTGENWTVKAGHEVSADGLTLYQVALHEIGHALGLDHYSGGPAIMNPYTGVSDLTASDIHGIQALYGANASGDAHTVLISGPGQTVTATGNDHFENNNQARTTFVFDHGYAQAVIEGFKVSGRDHDTLSLFSGDFSSARDVLKHTTNTASGALITDAITGDTIELTGVSKLSLAHHRGDFGFHT